MLKGFGKTDLNHFWLVKGYHFCRDCAKKVMDMMGLPEIQPWESLTCRHVLRLCSANGHSDVQSAQRHSLLFEKRRSYQEEQDIFSTLGTWWTLGEEKRLCWKGT